MNPSRVFAVLLLSSFARGDVLPPAQDTSSSKGKLTAVSGKATTLSVSATGKGLVLFNLGSLPDGVLPSDIANARLRIYFPSVKKAGDVEVRTATAAWDEVSKADEPTVSSGAALATIPAAMVVAKQFVEVEVTSTVQGWLTTPATNRGFAFVASGLTKVTLGAKEGAGTGYPCELDIEIQRAFMITDGSIGSTQLADGSVGTAQLATGAVGSTQLASNLTLGGTTVFGGGIKLPPTNGSSAGVIMQDDVSLLHTYGTGNFFAGTAAGNFTMTGGSNVGVGYYAFVANTTGFGNTSVGFESLKANTTGNSNTGIGFYALRNNLTGVGNVAIGVTALAANTAGMGNVAIGRSALESAKGDNNIAIGINAGVGYTTESGNILIANEGLMGDSNIIRIGGSHTDTYLSGVIHGDGSGLTNIPSPSIASLNLLTLPASTSSGVGVIRQGGLSLLHTFGSDNFFAGFNAGNFTMTGGDNFAAGYYALTNNTTGSHNTAVGGLALSGNTTGGGNTAMGFQAMQSSQSGSGNVAIGQGALFSITEGSNNVAVGLISGNVYTTESNNVTIASGGVVGDSGVIRIGKPNVHAHTYLAGVIHGDGSGLTGIPNNSLNLPITDADGSTGVIQQNGVSLLSTFGSENFFAGQGAGNFTMTGLQNLAIGKLGLASNTTGAGNVAVGGTALGANTTGYRNAAVGLGALGSSSTGDDNTALGNSALSQLTSGGSNSALGQSALIRLTTGSNNTAIGFRSGEHLQTGNDNLIFGAHAGQSTTSGSNNIYLANDGVDGESGKTRIGSTQTDTYLAGVIHGDGSGLTNLPATNLNLPVANADGVTGVIRQNGQPLINTYGTSNFFAGVNAGNFSTTGSGNLALGFTSLSYNTTGNSNIALGFSALHANDDGYENVAVGRIALANLAGNSSNQNTALGASSLQNLSAGLQNTALGNLTGLGLQTGTGNLFLGNGAGRNIATGDHNIDIGHDGVNGDSGIIRIGTGFHTATFLAGIRGVTTGQNNAVPVVIDSQGQLGTISSSRRYKEDIADMGDVSARLDALRPVTFHYKQPYTNGDKPVQFGLIAEEVAEVFPELAVRNAAGQPETVKYQDLTPLLLNEFQKERRHSREVESSLREVREENAELKKRLERVEALLTK